MSGRSAGPRRVDGFAPIGDYAALGDGRTVALVARDGAVDWFPPTALDGRPVFASLLSPEEGGAITLTPTDEFTVERSYVPGTNVVQTEFRTSSGVVRITDSLNVGRAGRLPWSELARRVEVVEGSVRLAWAVAPGHVPGDARPWTWRFDAEGGRSAAMIDVAHHHLALRLDGLGAGRIVAGAVRGEAILNRGDRGLLAVVASEQEPTYLPSCADIDSRVASSCDAWNRWCEDIGYDGPWFDAVRRSALALKLLVHSPNGSIAGAGTTSLPESLGGKRNFDYRYSWIRDGALTIDAFASLGMHEEVHACLSWLLKTVRSTAPDLRVFYRLDGSVPSGEMNELNVPGYRDSYPALSGNAAAGQTQLGTFGHLLDAVHRFVSHGAVLDGASSTLLGDLADRVCDIWMSTDAGIWELGDQQHYTSSKISCWVALDRAVRLARDGQVGARNVARWEQEAANIRRWIDEYCWSERKRAYTFYAGTKELDASVLLAARTGFADHDPARLNDTVDAVTRDLADGPLLYRFGSMRGEEGCFVACSFWRVQALVHTGRLAEAKQLMDQLVAMANDVGLYSEEVLPNGEMRGNIPQALSHLALVTSAIDYASAATAH